MSAKPLRREVADRTGEIDRFADLAKLASVETLPIYFGPLLGRLYLEGL